MSEWRRIAESIKLRVPAWKTHVLDYLESRGQRFCVDFGVENCVDKARQDWARRKRKAKKS